MKKQITKKAIYSRFGKNNTLCIGGWCFNYIAQCLDADFFHAGIYGWNADIFVFNGFCIVSGDRPFGTSSQKINDICEKANNNVKMMQTKEYKKAYIQKLEEDLYNLLNK